MHVGLGELSERAVGTGATRLPQVTERRKMISIVTPCFNEERSISHCIAEVARVMREELPDFDYEHIVCDNASTDSTAEILRTEAAADPHVKVVINSRNVGPFRNMANGLRNISGDLIVPMVPADIQDPPSVIPELVNLMGPEVDVVYGIRGNRRENFMLRFARSLYYSALRSSGGTTPPAHAGEFLLARREVIDAVMKVAGSYPYVRGLIAQTSPRYEVVHYAWGVRNAGKSRNSLPDLIDQALNGVVATARAPLRWALFLGLLMAILGIGIGIANLLVFIFAGTTASQGIPTLIVATFLFGGVNLFFIGLIGEYVLSIHSGIRPEPPMFERERINL